ncbi:hypothetical protein H6F88_16040 [Oculatella sp. FACHB-28]|uniref:hypothetical protein n=1 Tax=Oculatella sp. FACHB-28 TaxID=2692845 RepID=UPI001688863A|nr:hypothetical protein [Oculatella sp. FACHB-28]MBD2057514.1 hypothetical protein [Oculatella sp. FACHB-28]
MYRRSIRQNNYASGAGIGTECFAPTDTAIQTDLVLVAIALDQQSGSLLQQHKQYSCSNEHWAKLAIACQDN